MHQCRNLIGGVKVGTDSGGKVTASGLKRRQGRAGGGNKWEAAANGGPNTCGEGGGKVGGRCDSL